MQDAAPPHTYEPLSRQLRLLLEVNGREVVSTAGSLVEQTGGRGLYLVMIVLCLPFVIPVSIPCLSTIVGSLIMVVAGRMALGKQPYLPRSLGQRKLPPVVQNRIMTHSVWFLRWLEKFVRPRCAQWLALRPVRFVNALLIAWMAFLLALPLPPIIPLSNSFPSYAIILLAAGMMEEDGVTIWVGYLVALWTTFYFAFMIQFITTHIAGWWHGLMLHFAQ